MRNIWFTSEGDNWFQRNRESLGKGNPSQDFVINLLKLYEIHPIDVIEIGASNGYRLAFIQELFSSKVLGVEPSLKAINDGKKRYPKVRFIRSTCEDMKIKEKFDLVILNFVFHWIDRGNLFTCIKNIDDVLKDEGFLIIGDFGTENYIKRKYEHIKQKKLYTWKMPYWELFTKSGNYLEIAKLRFNHDSHKLTANMDHNNMGTVVLLKKQDKYIHL
ncbi:class I SAM-dependent methyltransferase [bacterium AH-315-M05]|nr:class I SAM-dependent methyltransferase [bacterium AH-315-M05]